MAAGRRSSSAGLVVAIVAAPTRPAWRAAPAHRRRPLGLAAELVLPRRRAGRARARREDAARDFYDAPRPLARRGAAPARGRPRETGSRRTPTAAPRRTTPAPDRRARRRRAVVPAGRRLRRHGHLDPTVTDLAERARATGRLGIDTEFMGEGRYRPLLCLVQVAVEEEDGDGARRGPRPARGRPRPRARSPPCSPTPTSRSSCTPAARTSRCCAASGRPTSRNVFDTQVAAGFAGRRAQLGYEALLARAPRRPPAQERELHALGRAPAQPRSRSATRARTSCTCSQLTDALQERARRAAAGSDWAREECRALEDVSDERDADAIFARLPRVNSLDPAQRAVARELVEWREETARERRPAGAEGPRRRRRSSRSPSAGPQRASSGSPRSAGSTRARCAGAGKAIVDAVERGRERQPIPSTASASRRPSPPTRR